MSRKPYPNDFTDEEWAFIAPYLTLMSEDAPRREHSRREVFNGLRYLARAGAPGFPYIVDQSRYRPNGC